MKFFMNCFVQIAVSRVDNDSKKIRNHLIFGIDLITIFSFLNFFPIKKLFNIVTFSQLWFILQKFIIWVFICVEYIPVDFLSFRVLFTKIRVFFSVK